MANEHDPAIQELIQTISLLIRRIRTTPGGEEDLSMTEAAILRRLVEEGPATIADLARAEHMKPQSMGTAVAGLETRGMIRRKADATDGRRMHLLVTAKGISARESRRAAKRSWIATQVAALSHKEQETLFRAGSILRRIVEKP